MSKSFLIFFGIVIGFVLLANFLRTWVTDGLQYALKTTGRSIIAIAIIAVVYIIATVVYKAVN